VSRSRRSDWVSFERFNCGPLLSSLPYPVSAAYRGHTLPCLSLACQMVLTNVDRRKNFGKRHVPVWSRTAARMDGGLAYSRSVPLGFTDKRALGPSASRQRKTSGF
jgi:hypothetical protein